MPDLLPVYEMIDLPLVPVLAAMERAGVKIDQKQLSVLSKAARFRMQEQGKADPPARRSGVQHQLAQATRRRALQQDESAQAGEIRQGQDHLHRCGCFWKSWPSSTKSRSASLNTGRYRS